MINKYETFMGRKSLGGLLLLASQDKKILKKINMLIKDIQRNNFIGIGKPEPLKENLAGYWSRRIDSMSTLFLMIQSL